jgi:hypothetical protein
MFKKLVRIFVEKVYKMLFLEGSGVPVLYIGRTVPKGCYELSHDIALNTCKGKQRSTNGMRMQRNEGYCGN